MNYLTPYITNVCQEENLVPRSDLMDSRTERDWLYFLTEFASLINFFDHSNSVKGNWKPFLLKDPVFLIAYISKTNFKKIHQEYVNACLEMEHVLKKHNDDGLYYALGRVFNRITDVFVTMHYWTYFMQHSDAEYNLKKYVLHQVKINYASILAAVNSLREKLYVDEQFRNIGPVDTFLFESFSQKVWNENKGHVPYWELLNLKYPLAENTTRVIYESLSAVGNKVFSFFHSVIANAANEYEVLKNQKSNYPDTLLLRTFVDLMGIYQNQINKIPERHLNFYFRDILKQKRLVGSPDRVFLCAETAKVTEVFTLPCGTILDAGVDAAKNPVLFKTLKDTNINPAQIVNATVFSAVQNADKTYALYSQLFATPGAISKQKNGQLKSRKTFSITPDEPKSKVEMGIAFASPLLLVREGMRTLFLDLKFTAGVDLDIFKRAKIFLTTQKSWLEVTGKINVKYTDSPDRNCISIICNLLETDPPIEAFPNNPDGTNSQWPMVKILFTKYPDLAHPPELTNMKILTQVWGVKSALLYNDFGMLSAKTPFQLFGPTPACNSNFYIGSQEVFSKPIDFININFTWDSPQKDFAEYYSVYNTYLTNKGIVIPPCTKGFWSNLWRRIKSCFKTTSSDTTSSNGDVSFNNTCFTVDFNILDNAQWNPVDLEKVDDCNQNGETATCNVYQAPTGSATPLATVSSLLFSEDADKKITGTSAFAWCPGDGTTLPYTPDPAIQFTPLKFSESSLTGFMKMTLSGGENGFGAGIYPKVVSYAALYNALVISNGCSASLLVPSPSVPYAPKVSEFTLNYSASFSHTLDYSQEEFPLQCYYYTPFENYLVYDNTRESSNYATYIGTGLVSPPVVSTNLRLYPFLKQNGALVLEATNLIPTDSFNLYFELARSIGNSDSINAIDFSYISQTGWKPMELVSDSTSGLSCSGILALHVPQDASALFLASFPKKYWISLCADDDGQFSDTVVLRSNGFVAERINSNVSGFEALVPVPAGTILKTKQPVPQVSSISQLFPSFGGKNAETDQQMQQRISRRLKTKGRAASNDDYYTMIKQEFEDVYYSQSYYNSITRTTEVRIVKAVTGESTTDAFAPLISKCREIAMQKFLQQRVSAFSNIQVSNFKFLYLTIKASVQIKSGYEQETIIDAVTESVKIYLSPWIKSEQSQISIDQGVSGVDLVKFIESQIGVLTVDSLTMSTIKLKDGKKKAVDNDVDLINRVKRGYLIVPAQHQLIKPSVSNP